MRNYVLNLSEKTLTITKAFEDAIATGEGAEYELYTKFLRDIPGLTVIRRTHASPSKCVSKATGEKFNCNQFKNLTYKNMEAFINGLPDGDDFLMPYNFIKTCGSLPLTSRYTAVRRWFVAQFPEFRKNPLFYLYNKPTVLETLSFIQEAKKEAEENALEKAG